MQESTGRNPIIIVDDFQEDLALLERVLHQCKLLNPIRRFSSGADCIGYFERHEQEHRRNSSLPALVLLDLIMLPNSGLQVLAFLRALGVVEKVPVVMLSGIRDMKAINEGYQLGARTFLIKPVCADDVVRLVNTLPRIEVEENENGYTLTSVPLPAPEADTSLFRKRRLAFPAEPKLQGN